MAINMIGVSGGHRASARRESLIAFRISAVVLAVAVPAFAWTMWASHSRALSSDAQVALNVALSDLQSTVTTAQSSMRGYVLSGTDAFLNPYRQSAEDFPGAIDAVTQTLATTRSDGEGVEVVGDLAQQQMDFIQSVVEARTDAGFDAASALITSGVGREIMAELRSAAAEMKTASNEVIARNAHFERLLTWLQLGIFLPAIAAAVYLAMLARRRQRQLRAGAELLNDLLDAAPVGTAFFDAKRRLVRTNQEFAGIVSSTGTDEAKQWLLPILERVLASREIVTDREFLFGEGQERRAVISAFPTKGATTNAGGVGVFV
ncbi:MAG: hypothetical protein EOO77_39635, partial [Oxalobacteraceae bacterium]